MVRVLPLLLLVVRHRPVDDGGPRRDGPDEGPDRLVHHRLGRHHGLARMAAASSATGSARADVHVAVDPRSLPVMGIGLRTTSDVPIFRVMIGVIGTAFVITQYSSRRSCSRPTASGTANATTAGWGNMGGGVPRWSCRFFTGLFAVTLGLGEYWVGAGLDALRRGGLLVDRDRLLLPHPGHPPGNFADLGPGPALPQAGSSKGCSAWRRVTQGLVLFCSTPRASASS